MATEAAAAAAAPPPGPVCVLFVGMAGSGKTSLVHALAAHLGDRAYTVNLDPAVADVPYGGNLDIRDTVDYASVMHEYGLGPNGAIMTSLNLYATKFDQVLDILERRAARGRGGEQQGEAAGQALPLEYILIDTPGQIEVFTWSASGQIITELLAGSFATVVVFVADAPRCAAPPVFMSNMLYALSVLYKCKLPMAVAFNKADVIDPQFASEWMADFEAFYAAIDDDASYQGSLSRSLCLVLEEFYRALRHCSVAALGGEGGAHPPEGVLAAVRDAAAEYWRDYRPARDAARAEAAERAGGMDRLRRDLGAMKVQGQQQAEQQGEQQGGQQEPETL